MNQSVESSFYSVSQAWQESESHCESVKLFLPDILHEPHYLPPNRLMQQSRKEIKEERARKRELFLIQRDLGDESLVRQAVANVIPQTKLNAVEKSIEQRLLKPFEKPEVLENLLQRVKVIESRRKSAKGIRASTIAQEPLTARSMENDSSINIRRSGTFTERHSQKRMRMLEHKKEKESKKMIDSLIELDKKMAKFNTEMAQRRACAKKEHERLQRWLIIVRVIKYASIFRTRIYEIRQQKLVSGQSYIASIVIQRAWRDHSRVQRGMLPIARSSATKVSLHASKFYNFAESVRNFIASNGGSSKLADRSHACTVITHFLREAGRCFKGYVQKYVQNITRLQRIIRRHQAVNLDRLNALTLLFDRAIPPLLGHIRIVASGRCLASSNLAPAELNAITRMCGKISTDALKVVNEMNSPEFHSLLLKKFSLDLKRHSKLGRSKECFIDFKVKRRVLMNYLYKSRRESVKKRFENEFRVQINTVSMDEVRAFIHNKSDDPLARNIDSMLAIQKRVHQHLCEGSFKLLRPSSTFYGLVFSVTAAVLAGLYFECREYERDLEISKLSFSRKIASMDEDELNLNDDESNPEIIIDDYDDDSSSSFIKEKRMLNSRSSSRKFSHRSSKSVGTPEAIKRRDSSMVLAQQLLEADSSGEENEKSSENSRDTTTNKSTSSNPDKTILKLNPTRPSVELKPSSSKQQPARRLSTKALS